MKMAQHVRFRSFLALALVAVIASVGVLLAAKGGGGKPPKDDPPPPPDISFSMKLLGTLGGSLSHVTAMNELGDVVGHSEMADGTEDAFVYFNDTGKMHRLRDLVTPADQVNWNWTGNLPRGINSLGQICTDLSKSNPSVSHAVRISLKFDEAGVVVPGQAVVEIVAPHNSYSTGINEFGDVTGKSFYTVAFVYTDKDGYREIGGLGGDYATPAAINNFGQVAGSSATVDGVLHAFLYTPGFGMEDLGIIKTWRDRSYPDRSYGRDLNDNGVVVGAAAAGNQKGFHVWHAFREAGNGMVDLGTLGGRRSWSKSINASGTIIGEADDKDNLDRQFIYKPTFGMVHLQPLITNLPADTLLIQVRQINNAGEICGNIWFNNGGFTIPQAFVLTPNE